jgi:glucosamine-phosphate N-acetyltransferase
MSNSNNASIDNTIIVIKYTYLKDLLGIYWQYITKIKEKYMELLSILSIISEISETMFIQNILEISERGCIFIGYIGEPGNSDFEIISTGTLFLEVKLSHGGKSVGHIEDIIVHSDFRGKGISSIIINNLIKESIDKNCYKIILQCKTEICPVYERNGFIKNGIEMVYRI